MDFPSADEIREESFHNNELLQEVLEDIKTTIGDAVAEGITSITYNFTDKHRFQKKQVIKFLESKGYVAEWDNVLLYLEISWN